MNMNSTTAITLNDRFSLIKKPSQTNMAGRGRSRSRSREPRQRQRQQRGVDLRGSQRNRALLDKLERQHKMRMALKLKNVGNNLFKIINLTNNFYAPIEKYFDYPWTNSRTNCTYQIETCSCHQENHECSHFVTK